MHPRRILSHHRTQLTCLAAAFALFSLSESGDAAPEALALDPAIVSLLSEVSQDSLFAHVQDLQDFVTRNTASDTLSSTMGIGAARRWVHTKYQDRGIQAGYFNWDADVCGVDRTHRNVLGTVVGSEPSRLVVVGAHLDSRTVDGCNTDAFQPGANDDASGVACLVELARLLPSLSLEASVVLQAFTGEEQGLVGSEAYAEHAIQQGLDIDAMINNDTIGNIDGCPGIPDCDNGPTTHQDSLSIRAFAGEPDTGASRQLARLAKLIGEAYVSEMTINLEPALDRPGRGGDHIPLHNVGYPAMRFIETLEYTLQQHNGADTIGNMEFSYLRRNVLINVALIANLAMAPETPGGTTAFDIGTGGGVRVNWDPVSGDVDGYRVAYRFTSEPDSLYYADIFDAGGATSFDITGLTDEVEIAVSVSAYDEDGHESRFSEEVLILPGTIPHVPPGFTVSSQASQIQLDWDTPPELDLDRIRIFRSLDPDVGFTVLDSVGAGTTSYVDASASSGVDYYYRISSVDLDGLESPQTDSDKGRLFELQFGILVVDATKDGSGGLGNPNDSQVDSYYSGLLAGNPVMAEWDYAAELSGGVALTDADLGRYKTAIIHSDLRQGPLGAATLELRQYVESGGQVFLCGWGLKQTLTGNTDLITTFAPGDFFYDVLKVGELRTAPNGESDFAGADPLDGSYPSLTVDSGKWPFQGANLIFMDALTGSPLDGAAPIEAYRSSDVPPGPNDGQVVGHAWPAVSPQVIFLDVPLYFMEEDGAESLLGQALREFGYGGADAPGTTGETALFFNVRPNPTAGRTELSFYLRRDSDVSLRIFDVQGRAVRSIWNGERLTGGEQTTAWDGRNDRGRPVPSGNYYASLEIDGRWFTREVTLIRRR